MQTNTLQQTDTLYQESKNIMLRTFMLNLSEAIDDPEFSAGSNFQNWNV